VAENFSDRQLETLLKLAGKRLGTDPEVLKKALKNGSAEDLAGRTGNETLKKALSDPKLAAELLRSPQAKALLKKLTEG